MSDERDSNVGLEFSVSVSFKRRRGNYTDVWEARLSMLAIALVTSVVLGYVVMQVFALLSRMLGGGE